MAGLEISTVPSVCSLLATGVPIAGTTGGKVRHILMAEVASILTGELSGGMVRKGILRFSCATGKFGGMVKFLPTGNDSSMAVFVQF